MPPSWGPGAAGRGMTSIPPPCVLPLPQKSYTPPKFGCKRRGGGNRVQSQGRLSAKDPASAPSSLAYQSPPQPQGEVRGRHSGTSSSQPVPGDRPPAAAPTGRNWSLSIPQGQIPPQGSSPLAWPQPASGQILEEAHLRWVVSQKGLRGGGGWRGEEGGRAGVPWGALGEGLGRVSRREDWGPGEGLWERRDDGAGSVSGSQDFGEAASVGAARFLGVLGFLGAGASG